MTKREDFFAAMHRKQPPGRVPLWELEFHIWDKVSGKHLMVGPEFAQLTRAGKERAVYSNADIFIEVCERLGFSAVTLPSQWWEISPGVPAYYWMPEEWRIEQTRVLRNMAPELILVQNCSALLGIPMGADYIPFAYKLFDAPDEIQELAEQKLKEGLESSARFFDLGVEVGLSTTDLADNHSTFMNPKQLERYVWPYLAKWVDGLRSMRMISILHSDGNLNACIDTIADSGVNCLQALDPTAGMDMPKVKERVNGKICLSGNVSVSLLVGGTPGDVFEATKNILENCKTGGGLALGASNAVQASVPLENYLALIEAWGSFGRYDESLRTK